MEKQVSFQRECLPALGAAEWTFTGVTAHVVDQMFLASERFRADVATVRGFSGVLAKVIGQVLFSSEGFVAEFTAVGRLASVDAYVVGQMFLPCERF